MCFLFFPWASLRMWHRAKYRQASGDPHLAIDFSNAKLLILMYGEIGMVIRTTEQWQALFMQHDESGVTAAKLCRKNVLCPKYFAKRKKIWIGRQIRPLSQGW